MATQTIQIISRAGINLDSVAVAADTGLTETWPGSGTEFLYVSNGAAAAITVTLTIPVTVDGQPVTNKTVSVAASAHALIGPFPRSSYNDTSNNVHIGWSSATSVKLAVLRLGT